MRRRHPQTFHIPLTNIGSVVAKALRQGRRKHQEWEGALRLKRELLGLKGYSLIFANKCMGLWPLCSPPAHASLHCEPKSCNNCGFPLEFSYQMLQTACLSKTSERPPSGLISMGALGGCRNPKFRHVRH